MDNPQLLPHIYLRLQKGYWFMEYMHTFYGYVTIHIPL